MYAKKLLDMFLLFIEKNPHVNLSSKGFCITPIMGIGDLFVQNYKISLNTLILISGKGASNEQIKIPEILELLKKYKHKKIIVKFSEITKFSNHHIDMAYFEDIKDINYIGKVNDICFLPYVSLDYFSRLVLQSEVV